jgi:tyrosyl-tRNA synthetase
LFLVFNRQLLAYSAAFSYNVALEAFCFAKKRKYMAENIAEQIQSLRRGTVEIFTEAELAEKLAEAAKTGRQLRIKLGLDPTSPDIHLGHTVVLRKMRQFQDLGHRAVLIIGDYTARIGDPSGQDTTRPMLSPQQIEKNAKTYFEQAGKILDTSQNKLDVRYNSEWLSDLRLADIIKLASSMTVARMLERDTFEVRHKKGEPIGVHEFMYPLMQGYDSVMIQSDVELGGTDQTFNNLVGRDLQRLNDQKPQIVITMPILVGLDGKEKMSKSKGNYIGVTDEPSDMFGKVMSISDEMMENYFTLLTDLSSEKIAELVDSNKTHPKEAKVLLGKTIVAQFYNEATAEQAAAEFDKVFAQGQLPDEIPEVEITAEPIAASKLLVYCKLVSSGGEAKRMIKQSAASIDGKKLNDPNAEIAPKNRMVIRVGKRNFARLKIKSF